MYLSRLKITKWGMLWSLHTSQNIGYDMLLWWARSLFFCWINTVKVVIFGGSYFRAYTNTCSSLFVGCIFHQNYERDYKYHCTNKFLQDLYLISKNKEKRSSREKKHLYIQYNLCNNPGYIQHSFPTEQKWYQASDAGVMVLCQDYWFLTSSRENTEQMIKSLCLECIQYLFQCYL